MIKDAVLRHSNITALNGFLVQELACAADQLRAAEARVLELEAELKIGEGTPMNFGITALNGFLFGFGMIIAAFLMRSLLHIGFCG
jgi:hypothetical protein